MLLTTAVAGALQGQDHLGRGSREGRREGGRREHMLDGTTRKNVHCSRPSLPRPLPLSPFLFFLTDLGMMRQHHLQEGLGVALSNQT